MKILTPYGVEQLARSTYYHYGWEPYVWYGYRHPTAPLLLWRVLIVTTFSLLNDKLEEWYAMPLANLVTNGDFRDALWHYMAVRCGQDMVRIPDLETYIHIPGAKRPVSNIEFGVPLAVCQPHPRAAYLPQFSEVVTHWRAN